MAGDSHCPQCGGTGWLIVERDGLSGAERCECVALSAAVADPEEAANIPPLYRSSSFDNFVLPHDNPIASRDLATVLVKVRAYVREFPVGPKPGLLLMGPTGTGKTHLAVAVMRELMKKGFRCMFYDYITLLQRIRAGYDPDAGASTREAYQSALESDVLVLDDLGAHRVLGWIEDTMTSIVTHRCNYRKPLVATTNLPDPDAGDATVQRSPGAGVEYRVSLGERIGERARSRLFEMCDVVKMPDVGDYRIRKSALKI